MRYPGGWEEDRWRLTEPGNYRWHIAEHDNGTMIWLTDPGGRGDNWSVKAGTGTRLSRSTHLASGLPNKSIAEGVAEEAMRDNASDPDYKKMGRYGGFGRR